jgi:hypothetical protein
MHVMVFPNSRRRQVEPVVRRALAAEPGTGDLVVTVVRLLQGWTVSAAGLRDRFREQVLSDRAQEALRRSGV